MSRVKKLNIIVPCYNEEESICQLFSKLKELELELNNLYEHEIIFIDDGSKDRTFEIITKKLATLKSARIIQHDVNQNLGAALKTGIKNSSKVDYIAFLDSDCTYEPSIIIKLVAEIEAGADLATASPYHPKGRVEGVPEWRLLLSRGLSLIYRILLDKDIYTYTAMVRVMRLEVAQKTFNPRNDFSFVAVVLLNSIRQGFKIIEVPAVLKVRAFGVSKMNVVKTINSHLKIIFRLLGGKIL